MNKEQVKHLTDVLSHLAVAQFLFFGGKNLYYYSKSYDYDVIVVCLSGLLYLVVHIIIHLILENNYE